MATKLTASPLQPVGTGHRSSIMYTLITQYTLLWRRRDSNPQPDHTNSLLIHLGFGAEGDPLSLVPAKVRLSGSTSSSDHTIPVQGWRPLRCRPS